MNRILIYFAAALLAGCGLPSSAPKETVGMFLSQPEYQGWESEAQKEVKRTIRKFNAFVEIFITIDIRFYKKDSKNKDGETDLLYDKTLIYEAVFQKKKFLSRKYKCINITGEYYLGKQYPVATKFAYFSYTLPLAESDTASCRRRMNDALLLTKDGV